MNTLALAQATAWLSERLPQAELADFAAMLAIGAAHQAVPVSSLVDTLGMSQAWVDGFIERHGSYQGGLAPFIEIRRGEAGAVAQLSSVGRNVLNQFWQRAGWTMPEHG